MNTEQELKKHHQAIKALEMIQYHERQLIEFEYDYGFRFNQLPNIKRRCKHMAECEQRCIDRIEKVYNAMGLNKSYGKH